jgi:PAS domain S-box-containing protein
MYINERAPTYARSLIEASLDPLITISKDGKIMDMNEALMTITGKTRQQLAGSDFFTYFTESQKARKVYQEIFEKGFVSNYPLTLKEHTLTDVLFNGSVYKDENGNVLGAVVVARDITEQNRIADELEKASRYTELATEIAEEARKKAEIATGIAEDAVKAKQQFLSNMSHEIRTPMNAIIGFTKVLLKTTLSVKQREYLEAIKTSGDALIVLLNDILDLAKVDAQKMTFEKTPFKMSSTIAAILHLFEIKIQEKNLVLVKEYDRAIPGILIGDPVRLHQIMLNLMSNAVKFTENGSITVQVRLQSEDEENATVAFSITDTGIGIAEENTEKIFETFRQASSGTARLYGGTGLGLAIVKQLVEQQDGEIHVSSNLNEGSTFSFSLNFQKTRQVDVWELETDTLEILNHDIKVLVVEDMALNQLLMKTLLDEFGFECTIAENGKVALEKLKEGIFDIILMDLQMPEMNGFEATKIIRATMNSAIPIIALTADVTTVDLEKCTALGMNDYIAKPVDDRLLYSKIVGLVKKTSGHQNADVPEQVSRKQENKKCVDLNYLTNRTKTNPVMMKEMISVFLKQTPPLVINMKKSFHDKSWESLYASVHKLIPSFSIMGMNADYEAMARKVQDFAKGQQQAEGMPNMINQLETVCTQACDELEEEFNRINELTP